jgi:hypothetical protein
MACMVVQCFQKSILSSLCLSRGYCNHAAKIKICPPPQDIKQLQRFLGMVNFYRRFLPNYAQVQKPLTDLLRGGAKILRWAAATQEAFQQAKRLLAAVVPLQHPAPNAELSLTTDASNTHIGGVMQQKSGDHWQPLGFFSRKLTDRESRYSTFDRKLLAAQAAIKHFCNFSKIVFSNFGPTTNPLLLPFLAFQYQFCPDNSTIWHLCQSSMYS